MSDPSDKAIISLYNVSKSFIVGGKEIPVLHSVKLKIRPNEFTIIYGPSGSGKSTLLNTIIGLEIPTKGRVYVNGVDISQMNEDQRAGIRNEYYGVVYQQSHWVKTLTVAENVALPLMIRGIDNNLSYLRAEDALRQVGMSEFATHNPMQLSGGQQQKIGLARALVTEPFVIVADEPSGNLDTKSSDDLMKILLNLIEQFGRTVVMVTHDLRFLSYAHRTFLIQDGYMKRECVGKEIKEIIKDTSNLVV